MGRVLPDPARPETCGCRRTHALHELTGTDNAATDARCTDAGRSHRTPDTGQADTGQADAGHADAYLSSRTCRCFWWVGCRRRLGRADRSGSRAPRQATTSVLAGRSVRPDRPCQSLLPQSAQLLVWWGLVGKGHRQCCQLAAKRAIFIDAEDHHAEHEPRRGRDRRQRRPRRLRHAAP